MNTVMKNGFLALLLMCTTAMSVSAQIKPSARKKTPPPAEQTDKPSTNEQDTQPAESEKPKSKPSVSTPKKTTAKKTDQYFDESGGFKHRLWYGGNIIFNNVPSPNFSYFTIGVTPMVGYKIIGGLSAGPRLGIGYSRYKAPTSGQNSVVKSVNLIDYTLGAFARYKAFKNIFAHAEYEYRSEQFPNVSNTYALLLDVNGNPIKQRFNRTNYYGGLGYNSGGLLGYEIMVLYNFGVDKTTESPISYRFGFTYNF